MIAFAATAFNCKKIPSGGVETTTKETQRTPRGVYTFGPTRLSPEQLTAIDNGVAGAFRDATASGYAQALLFEFYDIYAPPRPCEPSPEQRVPSFRLRADVYDGTEFDQYNPKGKGVKDGVGVILAAELVLSLGTRGSTVERGQLYVCSDPSHLTEAVRNGVEHIVIAHNDNDYFDRTWFHGDGFYHPLLPKREQRGVQAESRTFDQKQNLIVVPVR